MARNFLTETNSREPVADFHAIVTDHPRMKALGLGVFTTGDLNSWLHKLRTGYPPAASPPDKVFYSNWETLNYTSLDNLLGDTLKSDAGWGSFKAWRREGPTGKYHSKTINAWDYSYLDLDGSFTQDDLLLGDYWDISSPNGMIFTHIVPDGDTIADGWTSKGQTPSFLGRNFFEDSKNPILQIIEMNRWMNQFKRYYPRTEWTSSQHDKLKSANLFAMEAFLTDIKASKHGYLEFSGVVPFNINLADGGIQCVKEDIVKYKLFLYDDSKVRNTEKTAVLKSAKFGGYKRDTLGRPYRSSNDGELVDANTSNPQEQSVGELDRTWNPYTMKWESGSKNVFAKVVTEIGAAVNNPSVESLIDSDIKADLDGDPDRHFAPSSGLVMPIEIQNGNPMQWQPNYARSSGCREESRDKATVVGFNYNPLKSYPRDTLVMLTQLGGVWHITDMGSGIAKSDKVVNAVFDGKWEFQYMGTNTNNYFTGYTDATNPKGSKLTKIDPASVEASFHHDYYLGDVLNSDIFVEDFADYYDGEEIRWSKKGAKSFYGMNGWWQFTSFDFMDNLIGGTHDGNYLASTNPLVDAANRTVGVSDDSLGNAAHTGGFFGCIFPDGYTLNTTSNFFGVRDFVLLPASNQYNAGQVALDSNLHGPDPSQYFDTSVVSDDINVQPFEDPAPGYGEPESRDADGKLLVPYKPERSKLRSPVHEDDPEKTPVDDEGVLDADYNHLSFAYAPSMFFQETHKQQRALKQLPADIATLSSPSGQNGCPIQDIHSFGILYDPPNRDRIQGNVSSIFRRRYWLRKSTPLDPPISADEQLYNKQDSAFGFKPKSTNKVMFRPLKVGTWTQFLPNIKDYGHGVQLGQGGQRPNDRRFWSAEVTRMYHGTMGTIASPLSFNRNYAQLALTDARVPRESYVSALTNLYHEDKGLLLRGDIHPNSRWAETYNTHFHWQYYQGRVHDADFWNPDHFNETNENSLPPEFADDITANNNGGNVIGVIGAVATATANTQINFSTTNAFGMMCESHRSAVGSSSLKPAWGGSDVNDPFSHRTTALFATVFQAHPREDTIYDSRYFAVHHFNSNILDSGNPAVAGYFSNKPIVRLSVPFQRRTDDDEIETITNNIMTRGVVLDTDGVPYQDDENYYKIDQPIRMFPLEYITPTRFGSNGSNAISCEAGEVCFKNEVIGQGGGLLAEKYWNFNSNRLGKLLPYRYPVLKLGAPMESGVIFSTNTISRFKMSSSLDEEGETAGSLANLMVIRSSGQNYKRGDLIGNVNLKILISVEEVTDVNLPNGDLRRGAVSKIKLVSNGKIPQSFLSNSDALIKPGASAGYSIRGVAAAGNGFDGFFVNANVYQDLPIDHKPKVIDSNGRFFQLSSDADASTSQSVTNTRNDPQIILFGFGNLFGFGGGGGATSNMVGRDFGVVYGGRDQAMLIPTEQKSDSRKYDIFFHFHNDISHTFGDAFHGDTQNPYEIGEQYIQTTISAI